MIRLALILAVATLALPVAVAQTVPTQTPDSENGRYSFNTSDEGVLRLDTRTGQVSQCAKRPLGWACQAVPDERTALEAEIALLQTQNATLKRELIARGLPLPNGMKAPPPAEKKKADELVIKLPNDADINRVMTFMEKIWRRLIDMVQGSQRPMDNKG